MSSVIYVMRVAGLYKVGSSTQLDIRMKYLKADKLLFSRNVDESNLRRIESFVHAYLKCRHRVLLGREWYKPSDSLVDNVNAAIDKYYLGVIQKDPQLPDRRFTKWECRRHIANAVRIVRETNGWSTAEYAKMSKVTTYYLNNVLREEHSVGIDIVERLANVVDMSVSEFIAMGED